VIPSRKELRRMMCLFVRYSRRGRMGVDGFWSVLKEPKTWDSRYVLVNFLERRLKLKRVQMNG
jgi:hypothetical protein